MRTAIAAALLLASFDVLHAQEFGVFAARTARDGRATAYGGGGAIGVSFRLGAIMAESNRLSRSTLPVVARVSFTQVHATETDYSLCVDGCAPGAHEVRMLRQQLEGWLGAVPIHRNRTRLELGVGIVQNREQTTHLERYWRFSVGGALGRRVSSRTWVEAGYERQVWPVAGDIEDGPPQRPSARTLRVGVSVR